MLVIGRRQGEKIWVGTPENHLVVHVHRLAKPEVTLRISDGSRSFAALALGVQERLEIAPGVVIVVTAIRRGRAYLGVRAPDDIRVARTREYLEKKNYGPIPNPRSETNGRGTSDSPGRRDQRARQDR